MVVEWVSATKLQFLALQFYCGDLAKSSLPCWSEGCSCQYPASYLPSIGFAAGHSDRIEYVRIY